MKRSFAIAASAFALTTMITACGGGGGGTSTADGSMRFALTDAPACGMDHVWVTVEKVGVNPSGTAGDGDAGWREVTLSPARRIDLLTLGNGVLEELGTMPLAAGHYSQVRLVLSGNGVAGASATANSVQPTGAADTPLSTPSAQQSGLKLQASFDVAPGQLSDVVLDFDACKSVVQAGASGRYLLKPVISVVPRAVAGVQGFIATSMPLSGTSVAAQLNGITVRATAPDATGAFSIPYLGAGTYTIVVTAPGHATGVVTGVPVGTASTVVNGSTTAIATPASTVATVSGTVTASGGTVPVTDATVTAAQALSSGTTIEVASQPVDATLATYTFSLPVAPPVTAAWSATSLPALTADTAAGGKYNITVRAPSRAAQTKAVPVSSGAATADFSY